MTDHSVPENLYTAGDDTIAHGLKATELTFGSVKLEEGHVISHILDTGKTYDLTLNEKEERLASEEASSDSLNAKGEVDYREGEARKQGVVILDPHIPSRVKGCTASVSGTCDSALQPEIGCWGVHELNYKRNYSCRDSPIGSSASLALKTKGAQFVGGGTVERINKGERGVKRDRSRRIDTGMLVKGRAGGCPTQDLSERRVHATIDDQTARAFHSILNREYTEESTGARTIRQSGGKDRHSKVFTSKGPRDRRVRLSVSTAIQFYDVQDRLGYDQPSKAVDWLIKKAKSAIDDLESLSTVGLHSFVASGRDNASPTLRIQEPISGVSGLSACSFCTGSLACNSNEGSITNASKLARSNVAIDFSEESEGKGKDSPSQVIKQQAGDAKTPAEEPPIRSASGSNLILNEMQQDIDCASPPTNAKPDLDTHHEFPGLDDKLKTLELPATFKLETANSPQFDSTSNPHHRNLPCSEQDFVMFRDYSSMNDRGQAAAGKLGADVIKLQDREPLNFSSSELSYSLQSHDKFLYMADESFPSRCVDMSQMWFQDQPKINFPTSTAFSFSKFGARGSGQFQQLSSLPSIPLCQSIVHLQNQNLHSGTPNYAALQNNNFSSPATAPARQDNGSSSPSHLHSLMMRSPEEVCELGHQNSANRSVGDANHPGHYIVPSLTPTIAHTQNQEIYPLSQNVSMVEDELLSSSGITLGAHHLFRNLSRRSPFASSPAAGLNPRTTQAAYAIDPVNIPYYHNAVSSRSSISERVGDLDVHQRHCNQSEFRDHAGAALQ